MKDVEIYLPNRPGMLAGMTAALGAACISIEGGGVWTVNGHAVAHFLFDDTAPVVQVLTAHGFQVIAEHQVVLLRLDQEMPGQLGLLTGLMAQAEVNILVQYSDHDHQLVLVVDDISSAQRVADAWMQQRKANRPS